MGIATFLRARQRRDKEGGEQSPPEPEKPSYICPKCGKDCKIKMAYTNHVNACKGTHHHEITGNHNDGSAADDRGGLGF